MLGAATSKQEQVPGAVLGSPFGFSDILLQKTGLKPRLLWCIFREVLLRASATPEKGKRLGASQASPPKDE